MMRGDARSVCNVQEAGRVLRLEQLRRDFFRAVVALFALVVLVIAGYHWLISASPLQAMESHDAGIAVSPLGDILRMLC